MSIGHLERLRRWRDVTHKSCRSSDTGYRGGGSTLVRNRVQRLRAGYGGAYEATRDFNVEGDYYIAPILHGGLSVGLIVVE